MNHAWVTNTLSRMKNNSLKFLLKILEKKRCSVWVLLISVLFFECSQNKKLHIGLNAEYSFYVRRPHFMKKFNESKLANYHKAIKNLKNTTKRQKERCKCNGYNFSYSLIDISTYGKFHDILSFNICDTYIEQPLKRIHEIIFELSMPKDTLNEIEGFCFGGTITEILNNLYKDASRVNNLEIVDLVNKGPFLDVNYIEGANVGLCFLDKSLYRNKASIITINFPKRGFMETPRHLYDNMEFIKNYLQTININIKEALTNMAIYNIDFAKKWIKTYKLESGDILFVLEDVILHNSGNINCYPICKINKNPQSHRLTDTIKTAIFPDTQVIPKGCGEDSLLLYPTIFCKTFDRRMNKNKLFAMQSGSVGYSRVTKTGEYCEKIGTSEQENINHLSENLESSLEKLAIVYSFKGNKEPFVKSILNICIEKDFYKEAKACFNCYVFFAHFYMLLNSVFQTRFNKYAIIMFLTMLCCIFPLKVSMSLFYCMLIHNICKSLYDALIKKRYGIGPDTIEILYESWCEIYGNHSMLVKYIFYMLPILYYILLYACYGTHNDIASNSIIVTRAGINAVIMLQAAAYACYYELRLAALPLLVTAQMLNLYPKATLMVLYVLLGIMGYFIFFF